MASSTIDTSLALQAILRIAPLSISSASLMYSFAQQVFFGAFANPELASHPDEIAGKLLPHYVPTIWARGVPPILVGYPCGFLLGLGNVFGSAASENPLARKLYLAGSVFTACHFFYARAGRRITLQMSNKGPGSAPKNQAAITTWTEMNFRRTLIVNLPGWLSFFAATVVAFVHGN